MILKKMATLLMIQPTHASLSEKIRSGIAGGIAIFLLAFIVQHLPQTSYPLIMLASMAASAVLLFAVPHSPLAQPWNLIAGHFISALAGWGVVLFIHDPYIAAGVAVGMAIFLMHYLNCLHPPGAATALTIILSSTHFQSEGWQWFLAVVLINAFISLLLAIGINKLLPNRRYPSPQAAPTPSPTKLVTTFEEQDLEWALDQMKGVIDVSEEDLKKIYQYAIQHAQRRGASK